MGPIRDGFPAGTGILRTEFGEEEYIASGYGKLAMPDSSEFIGGIENHSPSGYGELRTDEGNLIKEGIFHGNKLVKEIRTIHLPGSSELFRGEVDESGNPHGSGVFFTEKGMYFGKFDHGQFVGEKPQEKSSKILIFTSYTPDRSDFNKIIIDNQKEYAEAYGYHYVEFLENSAKNLESEMTEEEGNVLPYWSKVAGMLELLHLLDPEKFPEKFRAHLPTEFIWLDDDAAITNQMVKMEDVIEHYAPESSQTHVFLTKDSMHKLGFDLNTAVLFVRNSKESRVVFNELWDRRHKLFNDPITYAKSTYATCPSQSCLHEQAALQDLMKLDQYSSKKYVRIIPQYDQNDPAQGWGINTFSRMSHVDKQRNKKMDYRSDDPLTRWKTGHFIGQATGMASDGHLVDQPQNRGNLRRIFMEVMTENTKKATVFNRVKKLFSDYLKDKL